MRALIAAALLAHVPLLSPTALQGQTLPGSSDIDGSKLKPAAWEVTVTFKRGDQEMRAGSTKYALVDLQDGRWAYITETTSQLGVATDTSIAMKKTLQPVSHRSHAVPRSLFLNYTGTTVTGMHTPRDSASRVINRTTEVPTFDASMLDLILAALPLKEGYTTRLPMYIEEQGGLTWFDIRVLGTADAAGAAGWDVQVSMPKYEVNFILAKDDHRFLGGRVKYPNGTIITMTRS